MDREQSRIASNRGEHTARRHGGEAVQKQRSRHGGKGREGKKSGVRTEGLRLKVVHFGGLSRHEGQTNPVTLTLVGGRSRDRTTGETRRTSADANAVSGGKASKGRRAPRGTSFRDEEKRGEPQDRQQGETDLHGRRGETAEVVQNHAGGTRDGRQSIPEGIERSGNLVLPRTSSPGVGLPGSVRWRGGLWKPQERKFGRLAEPYGSGRDGRAGVKVKRVERTFVFQAFRALVVRASWIPAYTA